MMQKTIPLKTLSDEWRKDPEFMREYESLEKEFADFRAMIEAKPEVLKQAEAS